MKLYVLKAMGWGEDEFAYEPVGVYDSLAKLRAAKAACVKQYQDPADPIRFEFEYDVFDLNAPV